MARGRKNSSDDAGVLLILLGVVGLIFIVVGLQSNKEYICQDTVFPCRAKTHKYGPDTHHGGKGGLRSQCEWENLTDEQKKALGCPGYD